MVKYAGKTGTEALTCIYHTEDGIVHKSYWPASSPPTR
jgi:hypothetical protein